MPTIKEFGGLDNQNKPSDYGLSRLEVAENVDITRNGKLVTRKGRKRLHTATIDAACSNKDSLLLQSGANLMMVVDETGLLLVESNLNVSNWLNSTEINGKIYWSNSVDCGVIDGGTSRPNGIPSPINSNHSHIVGSMPTGTYLYALTYIRNDGFESGASLSGQSYVSNGGIRVDFIGNLQENVESVCLYLSNANGDVLYLANQVNVNAGFVTYTGDTRNFGIALANQFCDKPVPYQSSCFYKGRMYYAHGNVLWASLPFNFELINYSQDFVAFNGDILMCCAVDNGIYVATSTETFFLSGNDVLDFVQTSVLGYGAIKCNAVSVEKIGDRPQGMMWASKRGAIAGFDGGQVVNLTDGVFAFGDAGNGTAVMREQDGQKHFIVSLNDEIAPYNARRIIMLSNIATRSTEIGGLFLVGELIEATIEAIPMNVDAS